MDLGLNGKVALVAAASQGLGYAVAKTLSLEGAKVAICGRRPSVLDAAAARLRTETGPEILPVTADVSDPDDVHRFVRNAADHFGRIDILVINAGGPPSGDFLDLNASSWSQAVDLTLMSAVNLCYAVVPRMQRAGGGRIVAITSFSVKQPQPNLILSNAIRMAVAGLVKSLSIELASYNILVNAVLPGWTRTDRVAALLKARAEKAGTTVEAVEADIVASIPLGRMATPEEFASVVAFLVSDRASYVTGVALPVDGGAIQSPL